MYRSDLTASTGSKEVTGQHLQEEEEVDRLSDWR